MCSIPCCRPAREVAYWLLPAPCPQTLVREAMLTLADRDLL